MSSGFRLAGRQTARLLWYQLPVQAWLAYNL